MRGKVLGLLLVALGLGVLIAALLPAGALVFVMGAAAVCFGLLSCRRC